MSQTSHPTPITLTVEDVIKNLSDANTTAVLDTDADDPDGCQW